MTKSGANFMLVCTFRVRYSETDKMGIVFNANYLSWFEVARTEFCRNFGKPYSLWEAEGFFLPVVESYCRYKSPCGYDDVVSLFCKMPAESLKPHSITFEYRITREPDRLVAEGWTKHAFVNAESKLYRRNNKFQKWLMEEAAKHCAE